MSMRRFLVASCASLLCVIPAAHAQKPAAGQLLVATPQLTDTNFSESVVLLVHHDDDGTIGVLINRPTWVQASSAFADIGIFQDYSGRIFFGGPVSPTRLLVLIRNPPDSLLEGTPVLGNTYITGDPDLLAGELLADTGDSTLRVYAGHALWAPGQLASEIADGGWQLLPGREGMVFSSDPEELWQQALLIRPELIVARPQSLR